MITLITGLPGNGKTLFALWYIKAMSEKGPREVYYHNIKDLALPWTLVDPEKWMDLPYGSIIVIDECQDVFPKRPNGSKLPDFYTELAKHRHKGFDIFLITQHPSLIDNFVRQLVGQHFHSVRKFGMSRSTIYEWSAANPGPQTPSSQKSAIPLKFPYPKEAYSWYKSAEVHTVKRSIPMKLVLAVLFIVCLIFLGIYVLDRYQSRGKPSVGDDLHSSPAGVGARAGAVSAGGSSKDAQGKLVFDSLSDARYFVQMNTPRVSGLPQTAPKYDQLTVPKRVPVPAMCVQRRAPVGKGVTCKCYTQQGTPMNVDPLMCVDFARDGFFQDFDADSDRMAQNRADAGFLASRSRFDDGGHVDRPASPVVMFTDVLEVSKLSASPFAKK